MANFKNHLIYGIGMSAIGSTVGYFQFGLTPAQSGAALIVGSAASLAPDLDHPEGLPGQILFEILGVLVPIVCTPMIPIEYKQNIGIEHWILYFTISYIFVRFCISYFFSKMLSHRGIFHSIPATIITGQIIFLWFHHLPLVQRCTIAGISSLGYFTHLLADEIYAVDWNGMEVKKSLGSAIDLGHISELSTWIAYIILGFLGYLIYGQII